MSSSNHPSHTVDFQRRQRSRQHHLKRNKIRSSQGAANVLGPVSAPHHLGLIPHHYQCPDIADNAYTGNVDMSQGTGRTEKPTSSVTFRVLPKIVSTTPVNARAGKAKQLRLPAITCQDANCADYATDSDDTFNAVSGKASYTAVSDTNFIVCPATADGNLIVTSDG